MEENKNLTQTGQVQGQMGQNQGEATHQVGLGGSSTQSTPIQSPESSQAWPQSGNVGTQPSQTLPHQPEISPNTEHKNGSKSALWIIIVLIVAALLALVVYLVMFSKESAPTPVPATIPTATPVEVTDQEELENIDIGDIDADLKEVESDLQSL